MVDRRLIIRTGPVMVAAVMVAPMYKRSTGGRTDDPANDSPIAAANRMTKQPPDTAGDDGTSQAVMGVRVADEQ